LGINGIFGTNELVEYVGAKTDGALDGHGHTHRTPNGPRFAVKQLPKRPLTTAAWFKLIYASCAANGVTGPAAVFLCAMGARETDVGRSCWNNAIGNVKQYDNLRPDGFWHRLSDHEAYVAFGNINDGMGYVIRICQNTTARRAAWRKALANDPTWYGDLGRTQYYGDGTDAASVEAAAVRGQRDFDNVFLPMARRALGSHGELANS
jgi:hypothetical protein